MHHLPSRYIPCDGRLTASTYFNPHSPHRERQSSSLLCVVLHYISIHAPRMGSNRPTSKKRCRILNFNPRSPHGERPVDRNLPVIILGFQSTLPAWGATVRRAWYYYRPLISIHAPRMGSDFVSFDTFHASRFQSTLPAWGATFVPLVLIRFFQYFNPRSPHGERPIMMIFCI